MEVKLAVSIWTLLLLTVESESSGASTSPTPTTETSPNPTEPNVTTTPCPCPSTDRQTAPPPETRLMVFKVHWDEHKSCEGKVHLCRLLSNGSVVDCSNDHDMTVEAQQRAAQKLLSGACKGRKGCTDKLYPVDGRKDLTIRCQVESPVDQCEAVGGYKAMTGLLLTLVVVILVVRFGKPTLKTFQKRLSDRRQSRWIGPTQSQSVSYHRGKTAVHSDTDKRLSYPALERLTINNSREPSSNRNSDFCDFI